MFIVISHTTTDFNGDYDLVEYTMDSLINTEFIVGLGQYGDNFMLKMIGGGKYELKPDQAAKVVSSLGLEEKVRLSRITKVKRWDDDMCEYLPLARDQVEFKYGKDVETEF